MHSSLAWGSHVPTPVPPMHDGLRRQTDVWLWTWSSPGKQKLWMGLLVEGVSSGDMVLRPKARKKARASGPKAAFTFKVTFLLLMRSQKDSPLPIQASPS